MKVKKLGWIFVLVVLFQGCAGLSFYKQENMKGEKVGIKGYYPKPYILVAREGITNKVTSVSLVFLPDLEHPIYAKAKSGYGSAILSLGFTNGIISSFGQQTDTKIPETLTSFGGLSSALATATKTFREADLLQKQSGDFGKYAEIISHVITDMKGMNQGVLTTNERKTVVEMLAALDILEKKFKAPGANAQPDPLIMELEVIIKMFANLAPPPDNLLTDPAKEVWGKIIKFKTELNSILEEIKAKEPFLPAFSLYEIIMQGGKTMFREVPLDKF